MKKFCEAISVHPESSCNCGLNNGFSFQNSVSKRCSSSQQPPLTSGLMNEPIPPSYNATPKNLSSLSPSQHWPETSNCIMVPASVPVMGNSSQQQVPLFQLMHGQIPVCHHPPMNNPNMVSPSEISDCIMVPPSVPVMGTSSQQRVSLFQHGQIPVGHHPPMNNPYMISPSATTLGVLSKTQVQVAHEGEVVPTVLDSQEMNTPIINNQNLNMAGAFASTTWFDSSMYDPTYEGLGLPMDPILRNFQQLSHKCGNHNNTSGMSQEDEIQLASILNQGGESSTESVAPHQIRGLLETGSTNNVALLQNNEHQELDLSTKGVAPFQSQNTQILNEESALSSQGSASLTIEDLVDLQLPYETIKELMRDLWPYIEEGQQNQMPNLQQEDQILFDKGSIHFQQQDQVQEGEGHNVWNNARGQQAIGMNLQDGEYGFLAELKTVRKS
ncbi:hypothetical protein NE237_013058 [Protea cynaroides]|uniref:Uncharacterized protein n=1 Tax=Protea cynaroides TaxID=273540 RepID=A0A9Q0H1A9_9MAGN|nr:hypothetical protein NE237_013058 [Protea cynaroides]